VVKLSVGRNGASKPHNGGTAAILSDTRMVLLKTTLAGVTLLVLGILALTVLGQYITVQVQDVRRRDIEPHAEFLVGDVSEWARLLPADVSVSGTADVKEVPSNQSSSIHFLVLDDENYQKWSTGSQATSLTSSTEQGKFNFTFRTGKNGVYHLIFDNRESLFKKYVTLSASYNEVVTNTVSDTRMQYVGWVLVVVGAVGTFYGLLRKAPVPWA